MILSLNQAQLSILKNYDGDIDKLATLHGKSVDLRNAFITGIASSEGINGPFTYEVVNGNLVITLPAKEPQTPVIEG